MNTPKGNIFALGKRYLVQYDKAPEKVGTIFLPDNAHQRIQRYGTIRELGTHVNTDTDKYQCRVGDKVVFNAHAGVTVIIEDPPGNEDTWVVLAEPDIVAVVRNKP